jgi:diguanylate cyclase (GGDEF)-like protein
VQIKALKMGVGRRIGVLVSTAVIATVLCVAGLLATYQAVQSAALKRDAIEGTAYVFASAVADHVESGQVHDIRTVLRSVDRVPGVISASVYDGKGGLIATLGQRAILKTRAVSSDPGFWEMMTAATIPVSVGIVKSGQPVGTLVLITDISDLRGRFFKTLAVVLAASLIAAAVGVLLSVPLQRRITQPIRKLTSSMMQIKENREYDTNLRSENEDETGIMVEAFNSLMSDIRFRDQSLQKLAYFDPLTGLPNRTNFQRTLQQQLDGLTGGYDSLGVVLFNIDAFHTFNDALGHSIGDAVLMNVAAVIKDNAGQAVMVARVGGDEFAVIVPDNGTGTQTEAAIARIQSAFYKALVILDLELHLSISAGATIMPRDSRNVSDAFRHIDLAGNAAKRLGPGRATFFTADMDDVVKRDTELGQALRSAISNNELEVHYQPQYDVRSSRIAGFEALLRWKHPQLGYVSPGLFIPIAEKGGLIGSIGDWIMEESCRQAKAWIDAGGTPRPVAVNVSPAQMLQSGFVRKVGQCLERTGLPGNMLCVELTESLFLGRSLSSVRAILDEIHALGVTLALDDFGTGFSSLAYLSQLPFDKLKIDRSFVNGTHTAPRRREILRSIIVMAHSLKMEVVAEGAEDAGEIELLKDLNADQIQGFGIARPEPAAAVMKTVARIESLRAGQTASLAG